ncbi:unnamed protein product [Arctia plantaginis]|uniref:Uncharacterized protein n=1 Tax=Arctia plantaginis TaxID=874455 RepID=A0A8S1BD14_ARCPL|nr:unnamed protein product [Arctia plantaginis]
MPRIRPKNGAQEPRPTPEASGLGLPCPGRARLKKDLCATGLWRCQKSIVLESTRGCASSHSETPYQQSGQLQGHTTAAKVVLGVSMGRRKCDKETWWWNNTVQTKTRVKKTLSKKWQASGSPEDHDAYIAAKRATKRAVARARSDHFHPLYEKLESSEG